MGNLPSVSLTADNFNLGLVPPGVGQDQIKLGVATKGDLNVLTSVVSKQVLVDTFELGVLVDDSALLLDRRDRGQLLAMRVNASVAGSAGSVTKTDPVGAVGTEATIGGVKFTAKTQGVRVRIVVAGNSTPLTIDVSTKDVTVNSATDGGGAATSTETLIAAAIAAKAEAAPLLSAANGAGVCSAAGYTALVFGSTAAMTVSGTPNNSYRVRVKTIKAGATGTATIKVSLDNGQTYGEEIATAASVVLTGTGLTLGFSGTFAVGDLFGFDCTGPAFSSGDLATALTALQADSREAGFCHIIGQITRANIAAIFASVASFADAFEALGRPMRFCLEGAGLESGESAATWAAAWVALKSSLSHPRIAVCLGECEVLAPVLTPAPARIMRRSHACPSMALRSTLSVGTDQGDQTIPALLPGVIKLYLHEQSETLAGKSYSVAYTSVGIDGFLCEGRLMDVTGGDYKYWQYGLVLDEGMRAVRRAMLKYQSAGVRTRRTAEGAYPAGSIDPVDATAIEKYATNAARVALNIRFGAGATRGEATDAYVLVDRTVSLISANNMPYRLNVQPLGYLKTLTGKAGLLNPALRS